MEKLNAVKILSSQNSMNYYAQSKLYLSSNNSAATLNDVAYVQSSDYAKIIGEKKCNQSTGKKRMTIVKIQHGKKSIHRRLCSVSAQGFTSGNIAISMNSFYELAEEGKKKDEIENVSVSKGCHFCYYWNHPFHATRISARLGFISVFFAIISIILTILSIV